MAFRTLEISKVAEMVHRSTKPSNFDLFTAKEICDKIGVESSECLIVYNDVDITRVD